MFCKGVSKTVNGKRHGYRYDYNATDKELSYFCNTHFKLTRIIIDNISAEHADLGELQMIFTTHCKY